MIVAIHQPQYLPWIPYCDKADQADVFVYLDNVQFQKNGLQNRNQILTNQGPRWLTVPVHASLDLAINQTGLADTRWAQKHCRTIAQEYRRAAFYKVFEQELEPILLRAQGNLAELNIEVTEWIFGQLGLVCQRRRASELELSGRKEELVLEICKSLGATVYLSGRGAASYQRPEHFAEHGIELRYQEYANQPYSQIQSDAFVPDLSVLDLILNLGPAALPLIRQGRLPFSSG